MADSGWTDDGQPVLKLITVAAVIVMIGAIGAALYWNSNYNSMRTIAGNYQREAQDEGVVSNFQSETISSLLNHETSTVVPQIILNHLPVSLTNSSAVVISYNATAMGYIQMNGTVPGDSWVTVCWGASTMGECQTDVSSRSNYALMAFMSGMEVPAFAGPMVIMMSTDVPGQATLTALYFS